MRAHKSQLSGFEQGFEQATTNALNSGGKIKFDLSGYDIKRGLPAKGKSLQEVEYTDWEFNQIIWNKELLDGTEFFKDGKLLPKEQVMDAVSAASTAIPE